jgi:hypothetical protein
LPEATRRALNQIMPALHELVAEAQRGGLGWDDAFAAYTLAKIGIGALSDPKSVAHRSIVRSARAVARAQAQGGAETEENIIRELCGKVGVSAAVYRRRHDPHWASAASGTPSGLREYLLGALPFVGGDAEGVPMVAALTDMLTKHTTKPRPKPGELSTTGFVADLLLATGACDTAEMDRTDVLKVVDNACKRHERIGKAQAR